MTQQLAAARDLTESTVRLVKNVRIPSSVPGLDLSADLYLPAGRSAATPAIVMVTSARKDAFGGIGTRRYCRDLAEHGYAAMYVDCFGVGRSAGAPRPMLAVEEIDDAVGVVEWTSAQPWCNGQVGLWGESHGATITLAVAARRPPALRAIGAIMGFTDIERDLVHPNGVRGGIAMFGHLALYDVLNSLLPPLRAGADPEAMSIWRERLERYEPWFVDAWRHGPGHHAWRERRVDAAQIDVPSFIVAGWRDIGCEAMISAYEQARGPSALVVGPWLHGYPDASPVEPIAVAAMLRSWWDRWLRPGEREEGISDVPTVFVQGDDSGWAQCHRWPPSSTDTLTYDTHSDGSLAVSAEPTQATETTHSPDGAAMLTLDCDPTVGATSGLSKHLVQAFGHPVDQHEDDARSMTFTTEPLSGSLVILGRVNVHLVLGGLTTATR